MFIQLDVAFVFLFLKIKYMIKETVSGKKERLYVKYLTGVQALNIPCLLNTNGDWHQSGIHWETLKMAESQGSFFDQYGIEGPKKVPMHKSKIYVANHIRALLDMLYDQDFSNAQGMRKDYIGNDSYNNIVFDQVYKMRNLSYWYLIDRFMESEYKLYWLAFKESRNNG